MSCSVAARLGLMDRRKGDRRCFVHIGESIFVSFLVCSLSRTEGTQLRDAPEGGDGISPVEALVQIELITQ